MHIQDTEQLDMGKHEYRAILQLIIQLTKFEVCVCVYRIISNVMWTIFFLIIQLIYFINCKCIYRILSNVKWGQ